MADAGLLGIPQVCERLGIKRSSIYKLREKKLLVPVKLLSRTLYRPEDVDTYAASLEAATPGVRVGTGRPKGDEKGGAA